MVYVCVNLRLEYLRLVSHSVRTCWNVEERRQAERESIVCVAGFGVIIQVDECCCSTIE